MRATCQTAGCANAGKPIDITDTDDDDGNTLELAAVYCGICGHQISDVTESDD